MIEVQELTDNIVDKFLEFPEFQDWFLDLDDQKDTDLRAEIDELIKAWIDELGEKETDVPDDTF